MTNKSEKEQKNMSDLKKRITNLLTKIRVDENSVLFAKGGTLNKKTVKKIQKADMQRTRFYMICVVVFLKTKIQQRNSRVKELFLLPLLYRRNR